MHLRSLGAYWLTFSGSELGGYHSEDLGWGQIICIFLPHCAVCGIGDETRAPTVEAPSLNHWASKVQKVKVFVV